MDAAEETLFAYASGELDGEEERAFEEMLLTSPELRREVERYEKLLVLLRAAAGEEVDVPENFASRVNRRVMLKAYLRAASGLFEGLLGAYGRAVLYYLR
ncbi:anti-sigma factor family protein [Rubrobacter indicoceani]|uniref:anti-sigma factor family protein n=1 Tax=Rubrobacter indicoceani TaxID=2051957 RepID=UPI000E5A29FE|nr:hypothetical protein [Rubrobacter indicoceani]